MATVKAIRYVSPTIPSFEKFKKSLEARCQTIISKKDPQYFDKINEEFRKLPFNKSDPQLVIKELVPLLNRNYANLAGLLGSLYEVKRGWSRLLLTHSIIESEPMMPDSRITMAQWWRFCSDSLWFADYGYLEKFIAFLKRFRRTLNKTNNNSYIEGIDDSIETIKGLLKITKLSRDPVAHTQSTALDDKSYKILWQLYLVVGYKMDFKIDPLEGIDTFLALDRKNIDELAYKWIKSDYMVTSRIFTQLNSIPLKNLSIA